MTALEDTRVHIMVDQEDGIESFGWVKQTSLTPDEVTAKARLESECPADEQQGGGESMTYECRGQVYIKPQDEECRSFEESKDGTGDVYFKFELVDHDG